MRVVAFDAAAARQAFVIHRYLRQTGQQIGRTDPLIAAQAIAMGAVCVTDNVRTFSEFRASSSKTVCSRTEFARRSGTVTVHDPTKVPLKIIVHTALVG